MAAMQRIGYTYCNEDLGVFGSHRHGPALRARLDNLPLWSECYAEFHAADVLSAGLHPDDVFFRGLAYRMMWTVHWHPERDELRFNLSDENSVPSNWQLQLLQVFNQVNDWMTQREILPDECGVLYRSNDGAQVLWAFESFDFPLAPSTHVQDMMDHFATTADVLGARKHHVYVIAK
jgi:hypothetical protein